MTRKWVITFGVICLFAMPALVFAAPTTEEEMAAAQYPVPREQAFVVETDTSYANFYIANPRVPRGTQWGSGWHQLANEWDWYMNYATGETILWRITGWEYASDNMSLEWYVRRGVEWNDGEPYTAHDIVFTYQLLMDDPGLNGASHAEHLASVEALDDYTVLFEFTKPQYRFHNKGRMWGGPEIMAKHVWEGNDTREYKNWPPVETGPFEFHLLDQDNGFFIWERNEDYWAEAVHGKSPAPKYGIYRMAPPPDIDLQEFIIGAVDAPLPHIFTIDMIRSAQRQSDHVVYAPFVDAVSQGISSFNTMAFPTDNVDVRWALQFLVNREKHERIYPMAESTTATMWPWPSWGSLDQFEIPAIEAKYGPDLRYDPAEAERRLDALGATKGSEGWRTGPGGEEIVLTILARPAPDLGFSHAQDFSDECRKIGIQTNLRIVDAAVFGDLAEVGDYHVAFDVLEIHTSFPTDPWRFLDSYHSKHVRPIGERQTEGDRSKSRLMDPRLDAIADEMAVTNPLDPDYLDLVEQGLDIWFENLPSVPAVDKTFVQTFSDRYWTNWPDENNMYEVPYLWWPEFIFITFELEPS
ncbi:MAG: hypothetical protein KAU31_04760, partial [Spirochaetaceae bacterium]|nr:hypothetical protein [Spirochaetaceae bacterium]